MIIFLTDGLIPPECSSVFTGGVDVDVGVIGTGASNTFSLYGNTLPDPDGSCHVVIIKGKSDFRLFGIKVPKGWPTVIKFRMSIFLLQHVVDTSCMNSDDIQFKHEQGIGNKRRKK